MTKSLPNFANANRRTVLAGAGAAATLALAGRPALAADPLGIGFVYVGPVGDHGWTYRHDQGRLQIEQELGEQVKTTFVGSVSEGPDAERVIRQLASTGSDLIFTTSFGFMNATVKVAQQFPNVRFEHATGYKRADNVATYNARFYQGRAICGTLAGYLSQTGKIGYIGSFPIPEVVRGINSFAIHLRKIQPEAEVIPVWVNTWYDPGREAEAAQALIDQGCDIIAQHTDSPAPLQVAEEAGVFAFGQASDMQKFAPSAQVTSIIDDWGPYYVRRTREVLDGSWVSADTWEGLAEGAVAMAPYGPMVTDAMRAAADAMEVAIREGSYDPFSGPITAQDGSEMVPAGAVADDGMLLGMNAYVAGVVGSIPE